MMLSTFIRFQVKFFCPPRGLSWRTLASYPYKSNKRYENKENTQRNYRNDDPGLASRLRKEIENSKGDLIFGLNPVSALLRYNSRKVWRVFIAAGSESKEDRLGRVIFQILHRLKIPIVRVDPQILDVITKNALHQGIVLLCEPLSMKSFPSAASVSDFLRLPPSIAHAELPTRTHPLLIALDGITDPHNLGAVLRSAMVLGADGIVLSKRDSPKLGGTVSKVSSGALEMWISECRLYHVNSMTSFLNRQREHGWCVVGAQAPSLASSLVPGIDVSNDEAEFDDFTESSEIPSEQGNAKSNVPSSTPLLKEYVPIDKLSLNLPIVLVFGSEGFGLKPSVQQACTIFSYVPMSARARQQDILIQNNERIRELKLKKKAISHDHNADNSLSEESFESSKELVNSLRNSAIAHLPVSSTDMIIENGYLEGKQLDVGELDIPTKDAVAQVDLLRCQLVDVESLNISTAAAVMIHSLLLPFNSDRKVILE